jgi:hypothetical protein
MLMKGQTVTMKDGNNSRIGCVGTVKDVTGAHALVTWPDDSVWERLDALHVSQEEEKLTCDNCGCESDMGMTEVIYVNLVNADNGMILQTAKLCRNCAEEVSLY